MVLISYCVPFATSGLRSQGKAVAWATSSTDGTRVLDGPTALVDGGRTNDPSLVGPRRKVGATSAKPERRGHKQGTVRTRLLTLPRRPVAIKERFISKTATFRRARTTVTRTLIVGAKAAVLTHTHSEAASSIAGRVAACSAQAIAARLVILPRMPMLVRQGRAR